MASIKLIEPKKKPRYYQITANVLVNGKIERRYGRFDFDPTELKNARARNAVCTEFRKLIGHSYIPPKWAFGFAQSQQRRKDLCSCSARVHSFKPFSDGSLGSSER